VRSSLKVGPDGRTPIVTQQMWIEKPPDTKVGHCLHPNGHHAVLAAVPVAEEKPAFLFTKCPQLEKNVLLGKRPATKILKY
jgi:hypothetical protein